MAHNEKVMEKNFCLYNPETFLQISVSTETEEFQNFSIYVADYVPRKKLFTMGLAGLDFDLYKSFASVDSMVYCIGGTTLNRHRMCEPTNEVTKFNAYQPTLNLEFCCNMIQPRVSPAVVSICGNIYVFGGLPKGKENCKECPWAEFLDTNQPQGKQKWKALKEPVYRLSEPLFAIQYEAQTILIGSSDYTNRDAIIYNVADESSLNYKFDPETMSYTSVTAPVTVFSTKTMYWIDDVLLRAYELDTHIHYQASMREAFPDFDIRFINTLQGPVLVHLKDDMFNIFSMFDNTVSDSRRIGLVECTKLRVTKCKLKSGKRVLQVDRVGYQSHQCDSMWDLCGAIPIEARHD